MLADDDEYDGEDCFEDDVDAPDEELDDDEDYPDDELETDENDDIDEDEMDELDVNEDENQVNIEDLDTMDIPFSGFSPAERAAEYRRRGQSPSGVIDGVYNDTQLPPGVAYNDINRDWDAGA